MTHVTVPSLARVAAFTFVLAVASSKAEASSGAHLVPSLRVDVPLLADAALAVVGGVVDDVEGTTRRATQIATPPTDARPEAPRRTPLELPEDYGWVERDTRAFWYATGTGAAATLATHVFVGLPALVLGGGAIAGIGASAPVALLAVGLGGAATYFLAESLLSAFLGTMVFDGTSETYQGHYVTAVAAHFAGSVLSAGVTTLSFGGGLLMLHGSALLAEFTASGGLSALQLFSLLGAMPAIVVAGVALVVGPALLTSWALAVTASPRPGFAIDDDWQSPSARVLEPERDGRRVAAVQPLWSIALPSP